MQSERRMGPPPEMSIAAGGRDAREREKRVEKVLDRSISDPDKNIDEQGDYRKGGQLHR